MLYASFKIKEKRKIKMKNRKGFTIVELVIVIAVIAILAAVLIPTFAGVIGKANQSSAQQLAMNGIKAGLLMTNTASLPKDTVVLVDSDKNAKSDPDYGYKYDGNALEQVAIYKDGSFITSLTTGMDTLLINNSCVKITGTEASSFVEGTSYFTRENAGSEGEYNYKLVSVTSTTFTSAGSLYTISCTIDDVLVNTVATAMGEKPASGAVTSSATVDKDGVIQITVGAKTFSCYTSPDMAKNVVIFVNLVKDET